MASPDRLGLASSAPRVTVEQMGFSPESGLNGTSSEFVMDTSVDVTASGKFFVPDIAADTFISTTPVRSRGTNAGFTECLEVEFDRQSAEATETKQVEFMQMQWNLLREQISLVNSEVTSIRQDINTLRLADSQYEVQNAETARHVREMQAQILSEMQIEAKRQEEVMWRLETAISSAMTEAQKATKGIGEVRERLPRDLALVDERVTNLVAVCEDRFANMRVLQHAAEEEKTRLDKALGVQSELASEVRSVKSDFADKVRDTQSSLRQAIGSLSDELAGEIHSLKERDMALKAKIQDVDDSARGNLEKAQEHTKDQLQQTVRESSARHAELKELISRVAAQERAAREEQASNQQVEIQDVQVKCRGWITEKLDEYKTFAERAHASLEELISQERIARGKEIAVFSERLTELQRQFKDTAVETNDWRNKAVTYTNLESLERKLLGEVARVADDFGVKFDQSKASLSNVLTSMENLDRKVDRRAKGTAVGEPGLGSGPGVEGLLSSLERKLRDEFSGHSSEHRCRNQELKDQLARFNHEHSSKHTEVSELVARISVQEKAAREDHKGQLFQTIDALEQKLRREISAASATYESAREQLVLEVRNRERAVAGVLERVEDVDRRARELTATEIRKLCEDLAVEHTARSAELKDSCMKVSLEVSVRHTEFKDQVTKLIAQEKSAREELRGQLVLGTDAMGTKLRRESEETKTFLERHTTTLREQLSKERLDREGQCNSIASSVSAVERRCREEMIARDEEQRSVFFEVKDDVAKALASELSARDELRIGITSSMEAFEVKMRREFADDSIIREYVSQERILREKGLNAVSDRVSDVERKLVADLAQVSIKREVALAELKDIIADVCLKDRSRLQELVIKETEGRAELQEAVQKQLSQERAARDVQQETLRLYLAQDRNQREEALRDRIDVRLKDFTPRMEFDGSLRRVWEAIDSHSYSFALSGEKTVKVDKTQKREDWLRDDSKTVPAIIPTMSAPSRANGTTTVVQPVTVVLPPSPPIASKVPGSVQTTLSVQQPGLMVGSVAPSRGPSVGVAPGPPPAIMRNNALQEMVQTLSSSVSCEPGLVFRDLEVRSGFLDGYTSPTPMGATVESRSVSRAGSKETAAVSIPPAPINSRSLSPMRA